MRRSLLIVALLAGAASSRAQDAPATPPAIQRIWTLGMDSSHAPRLAQVLLDSLGPRLLGSPDMEAAQAWAMYTLGGWGIESNKDVVGTWRGWRRGHSHIDLIAPRVRTLEGMMLGFSPGTKKKNRVAETIILPLFKDSTEFQQWLPNVKGKLVLVSAPFSSCRTTDDWQRNGLPETAAKDNAIRAANTREWSGVHSTSSTTRPMPLLPSTHT